MVHLNKSAHPFIAERIFQLLFVITFCFTLSRYLSEISYHSFPDLRNRVVGTRLIHQNISPYFFKWNSSFSATLYDPLDKCNINNNMITSPPSVLWLMQPLSSLNYSSICHKWIIIHYFFFLLTCLPLYLYFKERMARIFLLAAAILLLFSDQWSDSVLRGQSHFILPAILSATLLLTTKTGRFNFFFTGLLFAFAVWIRPNSILIVPFIILCGEVDKKQLIAGFFSGALLFICLTFLLHQQYYWVDFYHSCVEWAKNNAAGVKYIFCREHPSVEESKITKVTDPGSLIRWRSEVGDIFSLTQKIFHFIIHPVYLSAAFVIAYLVTLFISWRKPARFFSEALLTGLLLYWFSETTAPILKMTYYYTELFVAVLFFAGKFREIRLREKILLIASFLFTFIDILPMNLLLAELCLLACIGSYVLCVRRSAYDR